MQVRIGKSGDRLTSSCSNDGKNWSLTDPVSTPSTARDGAQDTLQSLRKPVTALS
ncbi:hypothetical protein [Nonomuraea sp. NEAU-A123]|uniref:hypothetical protein n=1 Tax=Nonomuraea sp. NEAU-A123 TaxID=2839649 RepID=UPI001BE49D01|nr:hypothetical protein [Nonomuraea sp. NEAU-A123]MBT2233978.1 hypothetical protein [Nonomuraea sp. NEAU-A123]